ncbi:zinc finger, CCHC-type [Artemisia annua]|uniref:Zinc finger, CCHC-type n=1 Tax=Artemisia annua TaxID=35608 RepID=A0A2U1MFJ8_ARTAN|nr:zinc finger, CCHC-type [Artemisia annua]
MMAHSSTLGPHQCQCPVLNNTNYTLWALRMKKILLANGVWDLVEGTITSKEIYVKKDSSVSAWFKNACIITQIARIIALHLKFRIMVPNAMPSQIALAIGRNLSHLCNASNSRN